MSSGYTTTPLAKKLGIKAGFRMSVIHAPAYYFDLFDDLPDGLQINKSSKYRVNFIHIFISSEKDLVNELPGLKNKIEPDGIIWVSWPKKASGIQTDINEQTIRALALHTGLVDIKVCAVDSIWSGLKLVIPVKDRKA